MGKSDNDYRKRRYDYEGDDFGESPVDKRKRKRKDRHTIREMIRQADIDKLIKKPEIIKNNDDITDKV
jgi:hypothetical protein